MKHVISMSYCFWTSKNAIYMITQTEDPFFRHFEDLSSTRPVADTGFEELLLRTEADNDEAPKYQSTKCISWVDNTGSQFSR